MILKQSNKYEKNLSSNQISNQIKSGVFDHEDYRKIQSFYLNHIKKERTQTPKVYHDLSKYYPRSVYALTGGWRAGKTTAAGMLLDIYNNDKKVDVASEMYHECFSFGNIDESISSFFKLLAIKTGITEFDKLGQVTTSGLDVGFSLGGISVKKALSSPIYSNEVKALISRKLNASESIHIVIIDDIDRLMPAEQYQWLKVIELLGKFHHKVTIIVPVHLDEVVKNLNDAFNLNHRYIDKIIPIENRVKVGVDLRHLRTIMGISDASNDRAKRLYSKYLISLGIRLSISEQANYQIRNRSEWFNEAYRGGISEIAYVFSQTLPNTDNNGGLEVDGRHLSRHETIWFKESRKDYSHLSLNNLFWNVFLSPSPYNNLSVSPDEIRENDFRHLRSIQVLYSVFGPNHFQVGDSLGRMPNDMDDDTWEDYWLRVIWPISARIQKDSNIAKHFTYEMINKEIAKLMKTESEEDERTVLSEMVLKWKY